MVSNTNCVLKSSDRILDIALNNMDDSNSLNSHFLTILFERDQMRNLLILRLAYNLDLIETLTIVNY